MNDIKWTELRTLNGSQKKGFEELCCQLVAHEDSPSGSKFVRVGDPDAGVECYWKLPGEDEWGWQAKFFRNPPGNSQWQQIDDSVKRALDKHPHLTRYIICLPLDRQDPRKEEQDWFKDKWDKHVEKWQFWAKDEGISVEFEYWGQSEILDRLSREEHRGRDYFWFNSELFSETWFTNRFEEARANVGPRYTPALNVDLPVAKLFDGLGRTPAFFERIGDKAHSVRKTYRRVNINSVPEEVGDSLQEVGEVLVGFADFVDEIRELVGPIDWASLCTDLERAVSQTNDCLDQLEEAAKKQKEKQQSHGSGEKSGPDTTSPHSEPYSYECYYLR